MFKSRKIAWENWNVLEEEMISSEELPDENDIDDENDEIEGVQNLMPFMMFGSKNIETPIGIYNEHSVLKPSSRWDCWICHTNFDITKSVIKTIEEIPGIEALKAMGRYSFFIGVARLFDIKDVRKKIEETLCSYTEEEILSDDELYEAVNKVKDQLDKEKFWTIMVTADGSIDYVSSNEMNKSYLDNVNKLISLKNKLGGIILHSNN
jgi:tRNA U54 and U55 pseudouridine synthase Pus10